MDPQFLRIRVLAVLVAFVAGLGIAGVLSLVLDRLGKRRAPKPERVIAIASLGVLAIGVLCFVYSFVEPRWLDVTHHELRTKQLPSGQRLRIVHLSDLHVDQKTRAIEDLPATVNALKPDLIVFTGDSLNSAEGAPVFREVFAQLDAPLGRYAVKGNHDVWYWQHIDLFGEGVATELRGSDPLVVADGRIALCGAPYGITGHFQECLHRAPAGAFTIAAYHTPDLVEDLRDPAPALYLAGHTHGGQVRVPFYGAILTLSKFDKKYEMGRYAVGTTTLNVNRGIGCEPEAPCIRFLARPEVTVIDVVGE